MMVRAELVVSTAPASVIGLPPRKTRGFSHGSRRRNIPDPPRDPTGVSSVSSGYFLRLSM